MLNRFRTITGREDDDIVYMGRIKGVLLFSDNFQWIEDAIQGRSSTLPADPWFETEFIRNSSAGNSVEVFLRPWLSQNLMSQHGREETGGALAPLRNFVPLTVTGEVTVLAKPETQGVQLTFSMPPTTNCADSVS